MTALVSYNLLGNKKQKVKVSPSCQMNRNIVTLNLNFMHEEGISFQYSAEFGEKIDYTIAS